jgi:hypothetical protein
MCLTHMKHTLTDSQTVFTVVLYLGSLFDNDMTVHYDSPAALGVEVP